MLNEQTILRQFSDWVEFRNSTAHGDQVIKVFVELGIPRYQAYIEWLSDDDVLRQIPMSVPLDEIIEFCVKAAEICGRELSKLRLAHSAFDTKPQSR